MKYIPGEHKNPPHFHDFDDNLILPNKGQEDKVTLSQLTITKKGKTGTSQLERNRVFATNSGFLIIYIFVSQCLDKG